MFIFQKTTFKELKKVGAVAYKLELPQEMSRVHNTFHASNLKKCYSNNPLVVPLEGLQVDDNSILLKSLLRDVAVYYHFAISTFPVEIVIRSSAFILEYLLQLHIQGDNTVLHDNTVLQDNNVIEQLMARSGMDLKMAKTGYHSHFISSSPHSTIVPSDSDTEDAFSSTNILNYFPASSGNIFSNSLKKISPPENTKPFVGSLIPLFPYLSLENASQKETIGHGMPRDAWLHLDCTLNRFSPITSYMPNSDPEEDKEDPEEDPADHPADG
ncbi:hypothetical protein Tco_1221599 [Tanacetum coccineum]